VDIQPQPQTLTTSDLTDIRGVGLNLVRAEPSHIHIPRPSRLARAAAAQLKDVPCAPAPLGLDEAAA
jgi:hypothetical protein